MSALKFFPTSRFFSAFAFFLGVVCWLALASGAHAQGTIVYHEGFPKTGPAGTRGILIKGTITPEAGWTVQSVDGWIWESGKKKGGFAVLFPNNKFGGVNGAGVNCPKGNTNYNIIVEATMIKAGQTNQVIVTMSHIVKSSN